MEMVNHLGKGGQGRVCWECVGANFVQFCAVHNVEIEMDQVLQIRHGPTEDKLKYLGTGWMLLALFIRAQPLGVGGLLVILAVEVRSDFLLKLVRLPHLSNRMFAS